jgi:hypothetical protein
MSKFEKASFYGLFGLTLGSPALASLAPNGLAYSLKTPLLNHGHTGLRVPLYGALVFALPLSTPRRFTPHLWLPAPLTARLLGAVSGHFWPLLGAVSGHFWPLLGAVSGHFWPLLATFEVVTPP